MMFWRGFRGVLTFAPLVLSAYDLLSWTLGGTVCALGIAAILIEAWIERTKSASTDWLEALILIESAAIVVLLAGLNVVVDGGFLVIVPFLARRLKGAIGPRTAYVASTLILFAGWATGNGWVPTFGEFVCAGGVALVAWFISKNNAAVATILQSPVPAAFAPIQITSDDQYEALRERYRTLRTEFRELERGTHSMKAVATLAEWRFDADRTISTLAKAVKEVARVSGVALFVVPDARDGFTLAGSYASPVSDECTLPVSLQASPIVMRDSAERVIKSLHEGPTTRVATVLLTDKGRLVGLAALFDDDRAPLEAGIDSVQHVAQFVASVLQDEHVTQRLRERVAQLELLNRFAGRTSEGSDRDTATGICEDVSKELELDGCAIVDLTGIEPKLVGAAGASVTDVLRFPGGSDIRGWMGAGAQEVMIDDSRKDERCDEVAALRRGIGAMMVQPLISSGSLIGAVVSWTAKRRGISSIALSTLRSLTPHILRQVFGGFASTKPGLVDADTFWHGTQGPGSFIEIDLGRTTASEAPKELQDARRLLITTAMGRLPQGGLMTRRSAGTLLAFLPGYDESAASRWAEALRPHAHEQWEMRVDGRGQSQQSRQFFERLSA